MSCSLCGAKGVNRLSCPFNSTALRPQASRHNATPKLPAPVIEGRSKGIDAGPPPKPVPEAKLKAKLRLPQDMDAPPRVSPPVSPPRVSPPRVSPPRVSPPRVAPPKVAPPRVAPPHVKDSIPGKLKAKIRAPQDMDVPKRVAPKRVAPHVKETIPAKLEAKLRPPQDMEARPGKLKAKIRAPQDMDAPKRVPRVVVAKRAKHVEVAPVELIVRLPQDMDAPPHRVVPQQMQSDEPIFRQVPDFRGTWIDPVQSTRGSINKEKLLVKLAGSVYLDQHMINCIKLMLYREQLYGHEWIAFYHSYNYPCLIYDTQTVIAEILYNLPHSRNNFIPRLFRKTYNKFSDISAILSELSRADVNDHDKSIRAALLSVTCSILADDMQKSEMSICTYFKNGYSCQDVDYYAILIRLLTSCGATKDQANTLLVQLLDVYKTHKIHEYYVPGRVPYILSAPPSVGNIVQIFVRKDLVDRLVYDSKPYGKPAHMEQGSLASTIDRTGQCDGGQARLLADPHYFMNPAQIKTFHYDSVHSLYLTRQQRLDQVRDIVAPLFANSDVRHAIYAKVEGIDEWL